MYLRIKGYLDATCLNVNKYEENGEHRPIWVIHQKNDDDFLATGNNSIIAIILIYKNKRLLWLCWIVSLIWEMLSLSVCVIFNDSFFSCIR